MRSDLCLKACTMQQVSPQQDPYPTQPTYPQLAFSNQMARSNQMLTNFIRRKGLNNLLQNQLVLLLLGTVVLI